MVFKQHTECVTQRLQNCPVEPFTRTVNEDCNNVKTRLEDLVSSFHYRNDSIVFNLGQVRL